MGEIFEKKWPTLQQLFTHAVKILSPHLLMDCLINYGNNFIMKNLIKSNLYALYSTDVIFQQSNHLLGNLLEGKAHFSGKHKSYNYNTEVSVAPTGYAVNLSEHLKGSILISPFFVAIWNIIVKWLKKVLVKVTFKIKVCCQQNILQVGGY